MQIEEVLRRLSGVKESHTKSGQYTAHCPCPGHGKGKGDKTRSLAVSTGKDGIVMHCNAGCQFSDICSALGIEPKDMFWESQKVYSTRKFTINELATDKQIPASKLSEYRLWEYDDKVLIRYFDENGNESGRTNISTHVKNVGAVEKMGKITVVPNPFRGESGFVGTGDTKNQIGFYGMPAKATIRIFSYAGQLIETIDHNDPVYSTAWFQVTRNGQDIASGIYFYVVTTPEGEETSGKFIIIK